MHGGEPEGEVPSVIFDEDPEKAFQGPEDCSVDHDGLLLGLVARGVHHVEALGEVEVHLGGGEGGGGGMERRE